MISRNAYSSAISCTALKGEEMKCIFPEAISSRFVFNAAALLIESFNGICEKTTEEMHINTATKHRINYSFVNF